MDQTIHKKETNLETIIRERRAIKEGFYNDKMVEEETVKKLLDSAIWAPTHGMRQTWRFIFVGADKKATFAKKVSLTYPEHMQANREEYLNKPSAILVIIMEEPEAQKQWDENYGATAAMRSEEHTSELQSRGHLVCRLLLEKKKTRINKQRNQEMV